MNAAARYAIVRIVGFFFLALIGCAIGALIAHAGTPEQLAIINANQGVTSATIAHPQDFVPGPTPASVGVYSNPTWDASRGIYITRDHSQWAYPLSNAWKSTTHTECLFDRNGKRYGCHLVSDLPAAIQPTTVTAARTEPRRILQRGK